MTNRLFAILTVAMVGCAPSRPAPGTAVPKEPATPEVAVRLIGGPTAILEVGGARFLTDPTFSEPGEYPAAPGRFLTKTEGPAVAPDAIGLVDAVLLSHDQHVDNLDPAGRAFVARVPTTFSTPLAAQRLTGRVTGLAPWREVVFTARNGRSFRITGVPAQHGPVDTDGITGPVTGFVLASDGLPTIYVSGDNASVAIVRELAARVPVDVALLFAGAAKSPKLLGDALLTLDGTLAAEAARLLPHATIVPVHFRGWRHFTEDGEALRAAFARAGMTPRLVLLSPGERVTLPLRPER